MRAETGAVMSAPFWTEEAKELSARSSLAVRAVRHGHLNGWDALAAVITGRPDDPAYMEKIREEAERIGDGFQEPSVVRATTHRDRQKARYHGDPEHRERHLQRCRDRRKSAEYRARERERAARRRAERKEAS